MIATFFFFWQSDECEMSQSEETGTGNSIGNELCEKRVNDTENGSFLHGDESEIDANQCEGIGKDKPNSGKSHCYCVKCRCFGYNLDGTCNFNYGDL